MSLLVTLIVATYGANKFIIMKNHDDTQVNDYVVKNGLSTERFYNDRLQLQFAFNAFYE